MSFQIGDDCIIDETATINVIDGFIGPRTIIRAGVIIEGYHVEIGAESYLDIRARIGGGSCWNKESSLVAGDWLHMGVDSHINTAERVTIGHEVGLGVGTKIFTHGAYLPFDWGFPVQWAPVTIGDYVWLPNAWVNPGVTIESFVVVAANSLVNSTRLEGHALYAGIPAKKVRDIPFYRQSNYRQNQILSDVVRKTKLQLAGDLDHHEFEVKVGGVIRVDETLFMMPSRMIIGPVTEVTEIFKNQLRRNGVRFRYIADGGEYRPWDEVSLL